MAGVERWLLPDGIAEILPNRALTVERLRRRLLDLYHRWGYDLVIPPLAEFTDSLLSGSGSDLELMTFKITDQISGRTMGVRADITPQVARMDAHSLRRAGPNRLCYAGQVLYTRARQPLASRSPLQVGVELFGEDGLGADEEVIALMIETLRTAGIDGAVLCLGHVGIYRGLEECAELNVAQREELFQLLQSKASGLETWLENNVRDAQIRKALGALPDLAGGLEVLERARSALANAPAEVAAALDELTAVLAAIEARFPGTRLSVDLAELRGYHYHTGIVFAAFAPGTSAALGNGGRYDHIGEAFGRSRPATGFGADLETLAALANDAQTVACGIFVPHSEAPPIVSEIARLRESGERVVCGFAGQTPDYQELHCDRELLLGADGQIQINPVQPH